MADWYDSYKMDDHCSNCGYTVATHHGINASCPLNSNRTGSGPYRTDSKFSLRVEAFQGRVLKQATKKTYKGECPCGISHPTRCDYHEIVP